jgi:hypothetical protein
MAKGEADMELRKTFQGLTSAGVRRIFLDMSRVREIDGACLQEVLSWGRRIAAMGGELALIRPGFNDIESLICLLRDLRSFSDVEEGLKAGISRRRIRLARKRPLRVLDRLFADQTIVGATA